MKTRKRITELDTLRGIAAVAVILYHYTSRFSSKFNNDIISSHYTFDYGQYGVELFFTISGFVIYMSVSKIINPVEFVYKRFIRLYPTFWIGMLITFIVTFLWGPSLLKVSLKDFIINFTMVPSLFGAKFVDGVYWTLKIELFFYTIILMLLILRCLEKVEILGYGYLSLGLITLFISQMYSSQLIDTLVNYYYYGLLFLCGINFYFIATHGSKVWNHLQILTSVFFSIIAGYEHTIVFVSVMIIFYLLVYDKLRFLSLGPLMFFGKISYALYLIHQNIGYTIQLNMIRMHFDNPLALVLIPFFIAVLLSWLITDYVDKKLMLQLSKLYQPKFNYNKI